MITRDEELKWAYLLDPCFELTNTAGKPLTDGYIEVYIAGTRNKYYCASDFAGTLHPFQIPLDSLGSNIVLANPDNAYDVYVYNRFGNLIMSRYNVTPADGGAVISNTERINDLEELVVSAVTGLQGQIDDINEALDGKKDKQEEYSVTLTPTQTVSAIMQNENGEIEVIYQEIDLPEEVPNVDIVSPASTINITTHIDEETNTKTFSIDLSDLGHLEYGQFMATQDVYTGANMYRIKGNLNTSLDGKIQLHKGNSYHITVRGYYTCGDISNTSDTLNYIEYSTFTNMPVNVDNTVAGPQYFEISYDVFKLSADTNYYIAFASSAGKVSNLTVEIHSLSNISILDPEFNYQEGWGIDIVSSVISVDPTIFNDYSTHTEVYEATVTAIQAATSVVPEIAQSDWAEDDPEAQSYIKNKPDLDVYATHDEVYESSVSSIQLVTGLIPDVSDFTTHDEVYESSVTAIQLVTGLIPTDYTTHEEVSEAIVTAIEYVTGIIPDAQVQSDWEQSDDTQPDYIKNKPDLDIYATHDEVNTVSGQIIEVVNNVSGDIIATVNNVSGQIIETVNNVSGQIIETVNNVSGDIIETVNNVSGDIIETVNNVSAVLHGEIQNIPEQVQADWDQSDDTQVDYIKNKPDLSIYATHDEVVSAVSSIDLSEYATHTEVYDSSVTAIQLVTGLIPDVSDFTTHDEVHESIVSALEYVTGIIPDAQVQSDWTETDTTDPAYIKHKPNQTELVAGQNIGIFDNGSTLTIAASSVDLTGYATETDVNSAIVTAINYVTGIIPDAQVQSDWNQTNSNQPDYIKNKPDLSVYTTEEEVIEIVSGVTGLTEYGQFYATAAVSGAAVMARTKGTIGVTNDGKIKLKQGSSYHVTVRGCYNQTTPNNVYSNISYIEYITFSNININVDKTITEPQYFEISYDLYKLNSDTDYYVFFSGLEGTVNDLFIEIHALGGLGGNGSVTGAAEYDAGWGIQILNNVISVNPSIIPDDINLVAGTNIGIIVSGNDLVIAASGADLSDYATLEQLQDSVELVTGLIPDTSDLATKAELQDGLELVTGLIPDVSDLATKEELQDGLELVTGLIPTVQLNSSNIVTSINNYPIYSEGGSGTTYTAGDGIDITNNIISIDNTVALKTDIPDEEEVEFEEINLGDYALASAIPDVSTLATKAELQDGLELVTGLIPTDYATHAEVNNVSGAIVDLIPELPDDLNLVAGQNIGITISNNDIVISASGSDMSDYVTQEELIEAVTAVTAAIPAAQVQSDWNESDDTDPAYIKNKPTIPSIEGLATVTQVSAVSGYLQSEIDNIPAQVQSDWAVTAVADPAYIQNKPDQVRLVAGQNITIVDDTDIVTISASVPSVSGYATKEELQDGLELVTGLIPDTSDMATQTWVGQQGYVTEPQVTALIPDSEEVEFEELDITQFAQASAIPTIGLNGSDQVTGIDGYAIAQSGGGGGTEYTAGDHIGIVNDEISVTGITELVAGNAITITTSGVSAIISSTGEAQVQADWSVTDSSSKAYIKNKPTIPDAQVQSNWNETNTSSKAYIQNKPTIHTYTGASGVAINNDTITLDNPIGLVAGANITIEVTGVSAIISAEGDTTYTAGDYISIDSNNVIAVTGLEPLPDSEEVDFEEVDLSSFALASAVPTVQLNGSNQVTAINNYPIAGGGGSSDSDVFIATYGTTTFGEIYQAYLANKVIYCKGTYATNEDTGILHYYQGYYGNPTFEGVILDGTYETRVTIRANSNPPSTSDSTTNWSGSQSTLALSSQIPAALSAGDGITINNNTINVDNSVITTAVPGFELPNSNFKLDGTGQAYKIESAPLTIPVTGSYSSGYTYITKADLTNAGTTTFYINNSNCKYVLVNYKQMDWNPIEEIRSDDPITSITLNSTYLSQGTTYIMFAWSTNKDADKWTPSTLADSAIDLEYRTTLITVPNASQGSGYSYINVSNLERRAYDITPSEGYTWSWMLLDQYEDTLASGSTSNGILDLSNISTANWNNARQLFIRKTAGSTNNSPVLSYEVGSTSYVPYIYAEAPSNTGTYVLKCINGVIQWVAET